MRFLFESFLRVFFMEVCINLCPLFVFKLFLLCSRTPPPKKKSPMPMNLPVHPRPPTQRECVTRSLLMARLPITCLCDMVQGYATEFQGLEYDPANLFQLLSHQHATSWMGLGPLPSQAVVDVVASYFHAAEPSSTSAVVSYGPMPMCVMPRGELAYWTEEQGVCVWDGRRVKSFKQCFARDWRASALVPFSDGCRLAIGLESGDVLCWDVEAESKKYLRRAANVWVGSVTGLVILSDESSRVIVVAGTSANEFRAWDVDLNVCVWSWSSRTAKSFFFAMVAFRNGDFVSGDSEGTVCMRDSRGGRVRHFKGHRRVVHVIVSVGDCMLATGSMDTTVRIWDAKNQACLQCLEGHTSAVLSLAELSMDRLASGSFDRTVRVWCVTTGDCLFTFTHDNPILDMVALPDGQLAVAAGLDVHVWNATDGTCARVLKRHTRIVNKLKVLYGGQLVSVDNGHTMYTWV